MTHEDIRHFLQIDRGGRAGRPRALDIAHPVLIGRDTRAEVVLDDAWVANQHCRLRWNGTGHWLIEDLGSRTGTFVNGERLFTVLALEDQDVVQVGGSRLVLRLLPAGGDQDSLQVGTQPSSPALHPGAAFTGILNGHGLQPTLRFLAATRKSGRLALEGGTDTGALWFVAGRICHAQTGTQEGPAAMGTLCRERSTATTVAFFEHEKPPRQSIGDPDPGRTGMPPGHAGDSAASGPGNGRDSSRGIGISV